MTAEESACRNVTEGTKRTKGHIILSHSAGCGSQAFRCAAPCLHFMIMLQRLSCVRRTAPAHATWSLQADIPGLSHASSTGLLLSAAQWAPFSHSQWLASAPPLERRGYERGKLPLSRGQTRAVGTRRSQSKLVLGRCDIVSVVCEMTL